MSVSGLCGLGFGNGDLEMLGEWPENVIPADVWLAACGRAEAETARFCNAIVATYD